MKARRAKRSPAARANSAAYLRARLRQAEQRLRRARGEAKEALEQQSTTAEILRVISSSPTDTQPVFDAIARSGLRLFAGMSVSVRLVKGNRNQRVAFVMGPGSAVNDDVESQWLPLDEQAISSRAVLRRELVHIADVLAEDWIGEESRDVARRMGYRAVAVAPMLREGKALGVIGVTRARPGSFRERELALLTTFAEQAAIALENVRLFNETREALDRQTATAEVLKVIASSPSDVQPVFEAIIRSASRLSGGCSVNLSRLIGDELHLVAYTPVNPRADEILRNAFPVSVNETARPLAEAVHRRSPYFVSDFETDTDVGPKAREVMGARGFRSTLYVPLMRGDVVHGVMHVSKVEPGPFPNQWIELLRTFADQAVIAIENVRLFQELQERNRELSESLDQQTATAAVLRVISSSPANLGPVFDALARSVSRLCDAPDVAIVRAEGPTMRFAASIGPFGQTFGPDLAVPIARGSVAGRAVLEHRTVHVEDLACESEDEYPEGKALQRRYGHRTMVAAPLLRGDAVFGAIAMLRSEVRPFSAKQIKLLETFADQAVIAIENARLFNEIQEKSRQLEKANRHKSEFLANMSHELRTPLNAIIGFTRIVMRRSKEQLESKQYDNLEKILSSGQHLLQLINAILDLSKVEAGRVEVNPGEVQLATVLEQCLKTVEPLVKGPAVRLLKDFNGELPKAFVDEEKLRQIVINLLSNAVKFTECGTVRLQAKGNGESFAVTVADTGIGIPADKLVHVFEEFAQADASSTRVYGGTGLGLTIARRLARLMGGDIAVESQPGAGSTFTLTLPVRYQAQA